MVVNLLVGDAGDFVLGRSGARKDCDSVVSCADSGAQDFGCDVCGRVSGMM